MSTRHAVDPLFLKDVELTFGDPVTGDDFGAHASSVTATPSSSTVTWSGLSPEAVFSETTTPTWSLAIAYAQDWDSEDSLSRFLFANQGQKVPLRFRPRRGNGPAFTCNVTITPGAIGGAVNAYAATTVTLGSDAPQLDEDGVPEP